MFSFISHDTGIQDVSTVDSVDSSSVGDQTVNIALCPPTLCITEGNLWCFLFWGRDESVTQCSEGLGTVPESPEPTGFDGSKQFWGSPRLHLCCLENYVVAGIQLRPLCMQVYDPRASSQPLISFLI